MRSLCAHSGTGSPDRSAPWQNFKLGLKENYSVKHHQIENESRTSKDYWMVKKLDEYFDSFLEIYVRAHTLTHKHWLRGNRFMKKFKIFTFCLIISQQSNSKESSNHGVAFFRLDDSLKTSHPLFLIYYLNLHLITYNKAKGGTPFWMFSPSQISKD